VKIIPCVEHFEELVSFVTRLNSDPAHHIGYFGVGEADVRASFAESLIPPAEGFYLAYDNEKLVGMFGVDANPEIGRAWLFGPIIEHDDWQNIADGLNAAIQPIIPSELREHELYCDANNVNVQEFAKRYDFPLHSDSAIFYLLRDEYKRLAKNESKIITYQEEYLEEFERLHKKLFPKAYFTAGQIVSKLDDNHHLYLAIKNEHLLGYHFSKLEIESESGYIDFIGVDESARSQGVGADLLAAGIDCLLATPSTKKIHLTVNADNTSALSLYNKFGFTTERVMRGFRKTIN
jgi:ribosomal protein S18 acetylase RimI-like enzyme